MFQDGDGMNGANRGPYLSSQLDEEETVDDEEEDADALRDPVYYTNLQQYMTDFLRSFCAQPYFPTNFLAHINSQEKQVLALIGINV